MKNYGNSLQPGDDKNVVAPLLEDTIRDIGIPPCPLILNKINIEMHKDEPDFDVLTEAINSDVGISAGLIALANSPFFGSKIHARSARDALMRLGLGITSRAIAGIILRKLFPASPALERFWHASGSIAQLSGWLTQAYPSTFRISSADAYTFGIFRDCAIPLLLQQVDHYPEALKQANSEKSRGFTEIEDAVCLMNHAEIGSIMAQSWCLPEEIWMAIRHHHDYSRLGVMGEPAIPAYSQGLITTSLLAEHLFQHCTHLSQTCEWPKGGNVSLQLLGVPDDALADMYESCKVVIASK